jgi:ribosome-associated protein
MTEELTSKSQRKRESHALQDLGSELVELNDEQLSAIDMPENLRDAVMEARRLEGKHEARRRQMQYIGKLMRHIDPAPIRERIDAYKMVSREATARLHRLERWRARLLDEDAALTELMSAYPHADAARIRTLVRNAERERAAGQPPKSFRALFKVLDETIVEDREGNP